MKPCSTGNVTQPPLGPPEVVQAEAGFYTADPALRAPEPGGACRPCPPGPPALHPVRVHPRAGPLAMRTASAECGSHIPSRGRPLRRSRSGSRGSGPRGGPGGWGRGRAGPGPDGRPSVAPGRWAGAAVVGPGRCVLQAARRELQVPALLLRPESRADRRQHRRKGPGIARPAPGSSAWRDRGGEDQAGPRVSHNAPPRPRRRPHCAGVSSYSPAGPTGCGWEDGTLRPASSPRSDFSTHPFIHSAQWLERSARTPTPQSRTLPWLLTVYWQPRGRRHRGGGGSARGMQRAGSPRGKSGVGGQGLGILRVISQPINK